jgi:hypothetical protein
VRVRLAMKTGCGLDIGVWAMRPLLDSETTRERNRRGGHGIPNGLTCNRVQSRPQSWPNLALPEGQGFGITLL